MAGTPDHPRRIRSYVLREGRLTTGQQRAFDTLWPLWGVEYQSAPIDLAALFGNDHPVFVEIGFGNGDSLAEMAQRHPGHNFLGIEVHRPGIGHLLLQVEQAGLGNVRVMRHDAVEVLTDMLPAHSLAGVYLLFPDPWHKKRHHKRRILQPGFVALVAGLLRPGGFLHCATDWQDYAVQMLEVLEASPTLVNRAGRGHYLPRPEGRPLTRFERRGQRLGHGVWDLVFERRQ